MLVENWMWWKDRSHHVVLENCRERKIKMCALVKKVGFSPVM